MKMSRWLVLWFTLTAGLFARNAAFDAFVESFSAEWMRANPSGATARQYFTGAEQDALDRQLTPNTRAAQDKFVARAKRGWTEVRQFDRAGLDASQRVSAAMMEWQLDAIVRSAPFDELGYVFDQFTGLQVELVSFLTNTHPIRNRRDIENYLVRLGQVAGQIDEGIAQAKSRAERGVIPPDFILQATLAQFDRFLEGTPRTNPLVASLEERASKLSDLPAADRAEFVAGAEQVTRDAIIPAFQRARALLAAQLPLAKPDAGIGRFADGEKAYANALRRMTTTEMSAVDVHTVGLAEVARIEAQMDRLLRGLGYTKGSIKVRVEQLNASLQPPAEPDPRSALIAKYEAITRDAEQRAALIFDLRPKAPVEVRREPPFTEKSAAAHYSLPARDGSRPGIFWVPLPGPEYPVVRMRTLSYHEAVPGHHFQLAVQGELPDLPRFRRDRIFGGISAHSEGWALYAEQLAAENGWYEGDVTGQLGQLDAELFRARRLVVDTGLHVMGWTRQQAIDYGIQASEVERYVVWPGQACSYKIGMLKILELRDRAKAALGEKFSIKEFHNVVLRTGTVPLAVLEQVIDDYIRTTRG